MKKVWSLLLCVALIFSLAACGGDEKEETQASSYSYEIAFLTASPEVSIDDGKSTQAAWEGLCQYAEANDKTYKYYEPTEDTEESRLARLAEAVEAGAEIVVAAGPQMAETIGTAQEQYPDMHFIYFDGTPVNSSGKDTVADNCIAIRFNQLQAGFLAGYSAVLEGFDTVAYFAEEENEEAAAYGYGFLQGCNEAAKRYRYYTDVYYKYADEKADASALEQQAEAWYAQGVDMIFAYGENTFDAAKSVAAEKERVVFAANTAPGYSKTVMTSAMKCYDDLLEKQMKAIADGTFKGGTAKQYGVKSDAVGLDMGRSKFTRFTKTMYQEIKKELEEGKLELVSAKNVKSIEKLKTKCSLYYIGIHEEN